jgi:biopolymer transport protein ExbD
MAAPKKRRIPIAIDMTPMVDIAFLLLIFFMSTTQFKKSGEVPVQLPLSHSVFKLPETGMIIITVDKNKDITMSLDNDVYDLQNGLMEVKPGERIPSRKHFTADKIPPVIHDLQIKRLVNRVVLRGDRETDYGTIESVMETLQKNDLNILNLVTDLVNEKVVYKDEGAKTGAPQ